MPHAAGYGRPIGTAHLLLREQRVLVGVGVIILSRHGGVTIGHPAMTLS